MNDEDLIGYLLDLLEPDEHAAVAARLETDPIAVTRLAALRDTLAPLDADRVAVFAEQGRATFSGLTVTQLGTGDDTRGACASR